MDKYKKLIASYINIEKPIGELTFCFGPNIVTDYHFYEKNVKKTVKLDLYGYYVYDKHTLFIEFPLSGFAYENEHIASKIDENAKKFEEELTAANRDAKKFEEELIATKCDRYIKNQIVLLMDIGGTHVHIFDDIWNIRIITRKISGKEVKYLTIETNNEGYLGPGDLCDDLIIRSKLEWIFNSRFNNPSKFEDERIWKRVSLDNSKVARYVCNQRDIKTSPETNEYRYPAVINKDNAPPHTHWPYPQDKDLDGDHYSDDVYYKKNPSDKKHKRRLSLKARFLNFYADYELRNSLKKGTMDERVGYPAYLVSKYSKEINEYNQKIEAEKIQKIESTREAVLTDLEKKVFNRDILTFRTGSAEKTNGKLPLIPTVINDEIKKLKNKFEYLKICEEHGIHEDRTENLHMCFLGNPGTGKTTVAREITQMFYDLGYIKHNECIEVNAQNMKGGYVGQTATITKAIIKHAKGRVLFIDEAYALYDDYENGYGKEAVAVLLKEMEDNRNDFIVIFAGYTEEMQKFLDMNEGLRSRINRYINFPDFTKEELCAIFSRQLANKGLFCNSSAMRKFFDKIPELKGMRNFSNARCVRNIVEKVVEEHAYNYMNDHRFFTDKYEITEKDLTDEIFKEIIKMSH